MSDFVLLSVQKDIRESEDVTMDIRKATVADLDGIEKIYDDIHTAEERGEQTIGWIRGVYPVRATAEAGLQRGDLYVMEEDGELLGTAIINDIQVDVYKGGKWDYEAADDEVCVLHTLVISPYAKGRGCGRTFVKFYEDYALQHGRHELRIDTNERNAAARAMYKKYGYKEIGIVPTVFNGIPDVMLVMLEKRV